MVARPMSVARHRILVRLLAEIAIAGLVAITWQHPAHGAVIIVVDTSVDDDVINSTCSVREAIIAANTNANL